MTDLMIVPGCLMLEEIGGMKPWRHGYALANAHGCQACLDLLCAHIIDEALDAVARNRGWGKTVSDRPTKAEMKSLRTWGDSLLSLGDPRAAVEGQRLHRLYERLRQTHFMGELKRHVPRRMFAAPRSGDPSVSPPQHQEEKK